jgi:hypothetical protein
LINAEARSHGLGAIDSFDQRFPADGVDLRVPT